MRENGYILAEKLEMEVRNPTDKSTLFKKKARVIVFLLLLLTFFSVEYVRYIRTDDACEQRKLFKVNSWQIVAPDPDVEILWQLSEQKPRATVLIGQPNSGITASDKQLIYLSESYDDVC